MFGNIGKIFKGAISNAATWVGSAISGAVGGPTGSKIGGTIGGKIATSLMTKKPGHGQWAPIDTSVAPPQLGEYSMSTYKMSDASAPDIKMKTVDADTLNAEWEYRLTKGLRNQNLFS